MSHPSGASQIPASVGSAPSGPPRLSSLGVARPSVVLRPAAAPPAAAPPATAPPATAASAAAAASASAAAAASTSHPLVPSTSSLATSAKAPVVARVNYSTSERNYIIHVQTVQLHVLRKIPSDFWDALSTAMNRRYHEQRVVRTGKSVETQWRDMCSDYRRHTSALTKGEDVAPFRSFDIKLMDTYMDTERAAKPNGASTRAWEDVAEHPNDASLVSFFPNLVSVGVGVPVSAGAAAPPFAGGPSANAGGPSAAAGASAASRPLDGGRGRGGGRGGRGGAAAAGNQLRMAEFRARGQAAQAKRKRAVDVEEETLSTLRKLTSSGKQTVKQCACGGVWDLHNTLLSAPLADCTAAGRTHTITLGQVVASSHSAPLQAQGNRPPAPRGLGLSSQFRPTGDENLNGEDEGAAPADLGGVDADSPPNLGPCPGLGDGTVCDFGPAFNVNCGICGALPPSEDLNSVYYAGDVATMAESVVRVRCVFSVFSCVC